VYDYHDALPAIAEYLCKAGLERDPRAALFAYNHADWYVDLVLDLAVRYDRLAPGGPTPDVLQVGPADQPVAALHYSAGRDLRQQSRARKVDGTIQWLGIPWRGRSPGQPIAQGLVTTVLSMVTANYGLETPASSVEATSEDIGSMAAAAWDNGLLAEPGDGEQWTIGEARRQLQRGHPVVVFVGGQGLPGHPRDQAISEQPLLLIGLTPSGFIYSDPTFSSSLGYGLEVSADDLAAYWDQPARPRQALALTRQPAVAAAHLAQAVAPVPITRVQLPRRPVALPAVPAATLAPTPTPTSTPTAVPQIPVTPVPVSVPAQVEARTEQGADGILMIAGVLAAITLWRARRPV
jgi:hypothetical protein